MYTLIRDTTTAEHADHAEILWGRASIAHDDNQRFRGRRD
jgi:hypothetical protein